MAASTRRLPVEASAWTSPCSACGIMAVTAARICCCTRAAVSGGALGFAGGLSAPFASASFRAFSRNARAVEPFESRSKSSATTKPASAGTDRASSFSSAAPFGRGLGLPLIAAIASRAASRSVMSAPFAVASSAGSPFADLFCSSRRMAISFFT